MSYYKVNVKFESEEVNKDGNPVLKKAEFLVAGDSVIEVEKKVAEYMEGTRGGFETVQITKTKIEAVIYDKNKYAEELFN
jgi:hypothetical protein